MAIFPTILQDAIIMVPQSDAFKKFEGRGSEYDVVKAFMDNTERLVPKSELESSKKSSRHVTKIPVLQKLDPSGVVGSDRNCTPAAGTVDTAFSPVSYSTYSFNFHMTPSWNEENYIKYQEEFAWNVIQRLQAFYATLDTDLVAFLETNKSLVNDSSLFGALTAGTKTVTDALKRSFYQSIPAIMRRNNLSDMKVLDIANTEAQIMYDDLARQGAGNAVNTSYQISNFAPYRSNRVAPAAGNQELHYLVPEGHLGLLEWLPYEFQKEITLSQTDGWTRMVDPLLGLTWGIRYKTDCTDLSAVSGGISDQTAAVVDKYEFSIDLAPLTSYSSDTSSAIFKYLIADPV